jgi:hypothetical protein
MNNCLSSYIRSRANLDGYVVRVSSARSRKGKNIFVRVWIRHGSADFVRTLEVSDLLYYNHCEEWEELYEEIKLQLLFVS